MMGECFTSVGSIAAAEREKALEEEIERLTAENKELKRALDEIRNRRPSYKMRAHDRQCEHAKATVEGDLHPAWHCPDCGDITPVELPESLKDPQQALKRGRELLDEWEDDPAANTKTKCGCGDDRERCPNRASGDWTGGLDMGSKEVEPKYLVDSESFEFAEYWLTDEYAEDAGLSHTELLHHKWELANEIQMCVESYFTHELAAEPDQEKP